MPLVPLLTQEARRRGLLEAGEALTPASAFRLVRDMPYVRASDRQPETVLREWRGTCSGKHYLLRAVLQELGLPATIIVATHYFTPENSPWLPPHLMAEVRLAPVPDVHNFLRVQYDPEDGEWMTVDATWPAAARRLGMPANLQWRPGVDQQVAADVEEVFHVPPDEDPQAFKERVVDLHAGGQSARRDVFIRSLSDWLARELG
jgi:arylamine N-acetyltransferase